jgi:argininosuccinate lyase
MLGTTHLQAAQPITLGYHLMAYFWMLQRDGERLAKIDPLAECPLGSCAIAGTSLPIDRDMVAKALGFKKPSRSAIDAVSDRGFIGDALHAFAQVMLHLSRLCQELILWSTPQFGYVRIADAFSTGSSLMPQKRNPDMAELIRGRAAQAVGAWVSFTTMMQAQPLAYNRDMQDDKPGLYRVVALTLDSLALTEGMLSTATFDTERMRRDAGLCGATSTGLAEYLVKQGVPFRKAHEETGRVVREADARGLDLCEISVEQLRELLPEATDQVVAMLTVDGSIASRTSYGGPAAEAFALQLEEAERALSEG